MYLRIAMCIATLAIATAGHAGGAYIGMIKPLHYGSLYLDASATQMSNRPACATRQYVRLQEAQTDVAYKEKFAMILSAWLADRPLALYGTGTCTSEGDEIIYVVGYP
jgi:hypothetical protein